MVLALCLILLFGVTLASCVSDIRQMRIPNAHVVMVLVLFAVAFIAAPDAFHVWWAHAAAMLVFLVLTYIMFAFGMLGAGDAKYGAALALWVGLPGLMAYVFFMAIIGGVLGVLSLLLRKYRPVKNPRAGSWVATVQDGGNAVPYGIALSIGVWAAFFHTAAFSHHLDELIRIIH
jgi:prepilin peptidase CpaA